MKVKKGINKVKSNNGELCKVAKLFLKTKKKSIAISVGYLSLFLKLNAFDEFSIISILISLSDNPLCNSIGKNLLIISECPGPPYFPSVGLRFLS